MIARLNANFGAQKWLADSGANAHITADATDIHEPQPFTKNSQYKSLI
jgi:hypothetical protein